MSALRLSVIFADGVYYGTYFVGVERLRIVRSIVPQDERFSLDVEISSADDDFV